ncbi:MAG TPA: galactose-1-phosphate uridylyltransferase [Thermodesulfobacteriota bacterium]|nr:galactose-1-phosphate uridylyltransferase [Thermodesulfobacteriota bacterium]
MPQLRQDRTTKEWVIIAAERAKRPHDLKKVEPAIERPYYQQDCPFCPGNEHLTPPETLAYRGGGPPNSKGWWVRVVPNKFPALVLEGSLERKEEKGFFRMMDGVGVHEVIIGSPVHNQLYPFLDDHEVGEVLLAYRERYLVLRQDERIKLIIIFKNHGKGAGTSLEHTHSQIVGTGIVPSNIRKKLEEAARYYDDHGCCVYCDLIEEELSIGKRIVMETERFVVLHPFASRFPFETWIIPKTHQASFGLISMEDSKSFAKVLKTTLFKLYSKLNDPDYNYVIHTAPIKDEGEDYYHWHLQITPRLTTPAGFEMGSGMYINIVFPEDTAQFLRED